MKNAQSAINKELLNIFDKFVDIMKNTDGVTGAWNFGSATHGLSDEYSDIDAVFFIDSTHFSSMEAYCASALEQTCDKVILCWEEEFNSNAIINNGYLLKLNDSVYQFDIFLLNSSCLDDYMCRIHYSELSAEDIIFDKDGSVLSLCNNNNIRGEPWRDDILRITKTYRYHFHMTAKYLLRADYFKLNRVMRTLLDTHASLLLTAYDGITWGGMENKLHFIPEDKQSHLKSYICTNDFKTNRDNLLKAFEWFEQDLREICTSKALDHDSSASDIIKKYWYELTKTI